MAEIKNVGGQSLPIDKNIERISDDAARLPNQNLPPSKAGENAVGRGAAGQPIGLPTTDPTTRNELMSSVVTGRDATQLIAAEKMRAAGGHSAIDVLLGLDKQPSTLGVLLAPPGNLEVLRHLSPTMRRKILRNLLSKQREQMRRFVHLMRDENQERQHQNEEDQAAETDAAELTPVDANLYNQRAVRDLEATTRMLDLLDELLGMQDYTLSQMGTFTQG